MKSNYLFACLMVSLAVPAFAQKATVSFESPIKVFVTQCEWAQPEVCKNGQMSTNQIEWWLKEGKRKFPHIQLVQDPEAADWVLSWAVTSSDVDVRLYRIESSDGERRIASLPEHVSRHTGGTESDKDAFIDMIKFLNSKQ